MGYRRGYEREKIPRVRLVKYPLQVTGISCGHPKKEYKNNLVDGGSNC